MPRSIENAKRRHSALGYKSPVAFEEEHGRWPIEGLHVCPPRGVQLSVRGRPDIKRALIRGPLILSECPRLAVGAPKRGVQQQIGTGQGAGEVDGLVGVVTDAVSAGREDHDGRREIRNRIGVMAGLAQHLAIG